MRPTICLVTRGRSEFLKQCLDSLEPCITNGLADVLVFDNGSPEKSAEMIYSWCQASKAELVRFDQNESSLARVWRIIVEKKLQWVVFPGDDDVFIPSSLLKFNEITSKNPELSSVAFNMDIIETNGNLTHVIRKPLFSTSTEICEIAARSFCEPQFLWPSLFFRADLIKSPVPSSRFYFDWWIGQQLILTGRTLYEDSSSVKYRVHPLQESRLGSTRRKFFESAFWMLEFIESKPFLEWLQNLEEQEIVKFWNFLVREKPVYSSETFGRVVLIQLGRAILRTRPSFESKNLIVGSLAVEQGVYLKRGEVSNFLFENLSLTSDVSSNISCVPTPGVCRQFALGLAFFSHDSLPKHTFQVSCFHTIDVATAIRFDCSKFVGLHGDQIADQIVFQLTQSAEDKGILDFSVTPFEKRQIVRLRLAKRFVPGRLLNFLRMVAYGRSGRY